MEITLGPVLFDWDRDKLIEFYNEAASMAIDTVYLGEVVCSRRHSLTLSDIEKIAKTLTDKGKKVYISTLAVVSNEEELSHIRALATLGYAIEANDMAAVSIAYGARSELSAGPHITTYNYSDMAFLARFGVKRVTFPVELPAKSVQYSIRKMPDIKTEVFGHGKVPLAFSWRCYTSRAFGLKKDNCQFDCRKFPEGMELKTLDSKPVFSINGTSILSAETYSLLGFTEELSAMGVGALRISPAPTRTADIVNIYRRRVDGEIDKENALSALDELVEGGLCNGWFAEHAGMDYIAEIEGSLIGDDLL